jgi:predicted Zn-dependent protease
MTFRGELMDGRIAGLRHVRLSPAEDGLLVVDEETEAPLDVWPWRGLTSDGLAEGTIHLRHGERGEALLTSSEAGLRALLESRGILRPALSARGRRLKRIVFYAGAIAAAVAAAYQALPALSRQVARRVPIDVEARLTMPVADLLDKNVCRDEGSRRALDALVRRLGEQPGLPAAGQVRLEVLNLELVNALTFPGGTIMLTRGLIEKAENPDEVAGIVAHELEHVRQRHIMAHLVRSSLLTLGWAVTVGDFSGFMVIDPQTAFQLANQRFSRDDERASDTGALARLERAGVSARGFGAFFGRLMKENGDSSKWLSTHPAHSERLARVDATVAREKAGTTTPALSDADWKALKGACAGRDKREGTLGRLFGGDGD